MAKDLRTALAMADSLDTPRALLGECAALWGRAEGLLGFSADNTEILRYLERSPGSSTDE
jgi:3-hydroxyisobutyrate dehydrogenase-like beta-hydroxyacid dehydrogenase